MAHVLAMVPPRIVLVVLLLLLLLPVVLLPAIVARRTVVPTVLSALGGMASRLSRRTAAEAPGPSFFHSRHFSRECC